MNSKNKWLILIAITIIVIIVGVAQYKENKTAERCLKCCNVEQSLDFKYNFNQQLQIRCFNNCRENESLCK